MNYVCEYCGKPFESTSRQAKYCSSECRVNAFAAKHGSMSAYRRKNYKKKVHAERECACCHKLFVPHRADVKYCSSACKYHMENVKSRVKNNNTNIHLVDSRGRITTKCACCGKPFVPEKDETMCKSCQAFLKFAKAHPEMI